MGGNILTRTNALAVAMLLFLGSGFSALVYEIVWFQMLQLVIGSSAWSIATLLSTFMGGMCLGSLVFPRLVSRRFHPLRVYALLELLIGVCGVVLLLVLPNITEHYSSRIQSGQSAFWVRSIVCAILLLIPTALMGATLPAIARWVESTPEGLSRIGFFYAFNIIGAVIGCSLTGFYLLRVHDGWTATFVAAAINGLVALTAILLARVANYQPHSLVAETSVRGATWSRLGIYMAIGVSGMTALAAEVIWTRLLSLLLGGTVYTFSIILSVFLIGLGLGSAAGSWIARTGHGAKTSLAICQAMLVLAILWSAFTLTQSLPYWPVDVRLTRSPWINFQMDMVRSAWAMLPGAVLWGASFPLALASLAADGRDSGRLVGRVYAANTFGAIVGALAAGLVMIAAIGTRESQQVLVGLAGLSAIVVLLSRVWDRRAAGTRPYWAGCLAIVSMTVAAILFVPTVPTGLIAYGRLLPTHSTLPKILESGEGLNASMAVSVDSEGVKNFHVSGKVVASSDPLDMRLQRMLGHLPALLHPQPRSVLIVGCGAGVTAGSFVIHPDVERIVICEIEPLIPPAAGRHFSEENHDVMNDDRVTVVIDDARHYILTTDERFDIITSDPIHPWVKGAASLYSREYFEQCKRKLNPGGFVTQWVPLYESTEVAVRSQVGTFLEAFPNGTIWSNDDFGMGYDLVLLGQVEPASIDVPQLYERWRSDDYVEVRKSLEQLEFNSDLDLLLTYAGQGRDLQPWVAGATINTDRNMRLQYLAALGINNDTAESIFDGMIAYRTYPENLFVVEAEAESLIRQIMARRANRLRSQNPPNEERDQ